MAGALWAVVGILLALLERERTGRGQRVDASLLGGALACLPLAITWHLGGQPMARGASELTGGLVCYQVYQAEDDGWMTLAALEPEFWMTFCRVVGREDLLDQQFAPAVPGEPAYEELCALFRTRTRQEWAEVLGGADACCEPVYSVGEALASAPVQALNMLAGDGLLPPMRLSALWQQVGNPAPDVGQHTVELLAELGCSQADMERMQRQGVT
jgi:crotonobetainyl-CoA:carnitine CoA-transferase CaiB-like acyl-CoA transferase